MEKANQDPEPNARNFKGQGDREVYDPVTGRTVWIRDAKLQGEAGSRLSLPSRYRPSGATDMPPFRTVDYQKLSIMDPNKLDPSQPFKGGPATNRPKENANIHHTTPTPVEPTNISMMPFPPPVDTEGLKTIANTINLYAMLIIAGLGVIWFFTAFRGAGWKSFLFFSEIIGAVALCVFFAHGLVIRKIEKEFESIRQYMHQERGEQYVPPTPEYVVSLVSFLSETRCSPQRFLHRSTEWLNAFTKVVWPLINPDMFISVIDMIEDVMQASLPGFVDAVKVRSDWPEVSRAAALAEN